MRRITTYETGLISDAIGVKIRKFMLKGCLMEFKFLKVFLFLYKILDCYCKFIRVNMQVTSSAL